MAGDLRLVELLGPPGAGKSTVLAALCAEGVVESPVLRRGPHRWRLRRAILGTAAELVRRRVRWSQWDRELLVMTAYLRVLPEVLGGPGVLVFDQGPLYTLSRPGLRDARARGLYEAELKRWRALLDVVVWLDAADDVLAERIDTRGKEHRYKGDDRAEVARRLAADRAVYGELLGRLDGGPAILRFDTGRQSPSDVVAAVLAQP